MANSRRRLPTTLIAGALGVLFAIEVTGIALARSSPMLVVEPGVSTAPATEASGSAGLGSALGHTIGSASAVSMSPVVDGLRSASILTTLVVPPAEAAN